MKQIVKLIPILFILFHSQSVFAQKIPQEYFDLIKQADSLFQSKQFQASSTIFSQAFKANNWLALPTDRYKAASAWAKAGNADSAIFQLERIATKGNFMDYKGTEADTNFFSLHQDSRWNPVLDQMKQNRDKMEAKWNRPVMMQLDTVFKADQFYRQQLDSLSKKFGWDSQELKDLWKIINEKDSINLIIVTSILDQYGWLGYDVVGGLGSITLFLVIQHADQATQEKYLPMMREAVKNKKANGADLALLEDRVALRQGKRQIYGSQIGMDGKSQKYYVSPLEDPDNVDKRRAEVGLQPIADYLKNWNLKWDVEDYKKKLPKLEKKLSKMQRS